MKHLFGVMAITLLAYALTAGGHLYSPDEELMFRTARALAHGEGLLIKPLGESGFATVPATPPDPAGREYAQYGVGQAIAAVPLVWIGEGLGRLGGAEFWQRLYGPATTGLAAGGVEPSGRELGARHAVSWFNILLGPFIAALVYLLCGAVTGSRGAAWAAALLYALGTFAWPHSRTFFTEPFATFWLLLAFYAIVRALPELRVKWLIVAGVAGGCALLVRQDSIVAFPALSLLVIWPSLVRWRTARRKSGPSRPSKKPVRSKCDYPTPSSPAKTANSTTTAASTSQPSSGPRSRTPATAATHKGPARSPCRWCARSVGARHFT